MSDDRFSHEVEETWDSGSGEGHALYARLTVEDTETGETYTIRLRNAVDIGWQAFREDRDDLDPFRVHEDDETHEALWSYCKEHSPIYTGHRQTPADGTSRQFGGGDSRGWPY